MEWFRKAVHKVRQIQRIKRSRGFAFSQNESGQADLIRYVERLRHWIRVWMTKAVPLVESTTQQRGNPRVRSGQGFDSTFILESTNMLWKRYWKVFYFVHNINSLKSNKYGFVLTVNVWCDLRNRC